MISTRSATGAARRPLARASILIEGPGVIRPRLARRTRTRLAGIIGGALCLAAPALARAEGMPDKPLCLMSISVETQFVVLVDPAATGSGSSLAFALEKPPSASPGDLVKVEKSGDQTVLRVLEAASPKCKPLLAKPHH